MHRIRKNINPSQLLFALSSSLHCKDGRALELNIVVSVAPGYLSNYTTIVNVVPRFAVVNNLPFPVRIWQDSSLFRSISGDDIASSEKLSKWRFSQSRHHRNAIVNQYELLWGRHAILDDRASPLKGTTAHGSALLIATVNPSEILPFSLPDSRGERQLRVDLGYPWNLTGSISADKPGDFVLTVNPRLARDLPKSAHALPSTASRL